MTIDAKHSKYRRHEKDYEVGYGKPPKHTQFKQGERRGGRAKGSRNLMAVFKEVVAKKVKVTEGVNVRIMSLGEAVLRTNFREAIKGNRMAMNNIFTLADQLDMFKDLTDPKQRPGLLVVPRSPEGMTVEEWVWAASKLRSPSGSGEEK
jgi:hypothetical protein